jgi:type I restriction enzyme S subunit
MSLPKYPAYKDSGVDWLGGVPSHWEVLRLKYRCEVFPSNVDKHSRDNEPSVRLCNYTDVYYNERITPDMEFMEATASPEQIERFTLRAGDTIITKDSETADDIAIATYVPQDLPGVVCGYHLSMVRPKKATSGAFVKRLFDSFYAKARFAVAANGLTRVGLSQYALDNVELPFPPHEEQIAIAAFLDRETAKIDALIAEQEKLIALLTEKCKVTISHAVTRGLNPDKPLKDSGVAWLGHVPAHWGVSALSHLCVIETGSTPDRGEARYWNGSIPWVKTGEINWAPIREAEEFITEDGLANSAVKIAMPGTLLMAMYGQGVTRGRVALLEIEATYNQACAAIRFGPRIVPEFGRYFFMAAYDHVRDAGNETSQMNLSAGLISKIRLPVPPIDEQAAVVRLLDSETAKLDSLETEAVRAIALLNERRSALIAAAVTGQIDVRSGATAPEATAVEVAA